MGSLAQDVWYFATISTPGESSSVPLSEFEIAVGGITSIPVVAGAIYISFKAFGQKNLIGDESKDVRKAPIVASPGDKAEKQIAKVRESTSKADKKIETQ